MTQRAMRRCGLLLSLALGVTALAPAVAHGAAYNFFNTQPLFPKESIGTFGHAEIYPSSIQVAGVAEPVSKLTVTLIEYSSGRPTDSDILLAGRMASW